IKQNIGGDMFSKPLDQSISFENASTARELLLENIINPLKPELQVSSNIKIGDREKEKILERVFKYELSETVQNFVDRYDQVFGKRSSFLWKWLGVVYKDSGVALSTIDPRLLESVTDTKILFTMFC
ncbi:unnamed protein product, partial [marine sediment metagenome]